MTHLLIDGRNTAYRSLFASRGGGSIHDHPLVIWLRFMSGWFHKFKPDTISVYWDCPRGKVWRKRILAEYKDHRRLNEVTDNDEIRAGLIEIEEGARELFPLMNIRQYSRESQEADDLIYAACKVLSPDNIIVVSSDSDLIQLHWNMRNVQCYDAMRQTIMPPGDVNPIVLKSLVGDKSDNIDGYNGIGPVRGRVLAGDRAQLVQFLNKRGDGQFRRNLALIDLSLNPMTLTNQNYILKETQQPILFDSDRLFEIAQRRRLAGFISDFSRTTLAFKALI